MFALRQVLRQGDGTDSTFSWQRNRGRQLRQRLQTALALQVIPALETRSVPTVDLAWGPIAGCGEGEEWKINTRNVRYQITGSTGLMGGCVLHKCRMNVEGSQ